MAKPSLFEAVVKLSGDLGDAGLEVTQCRLDVCEGALHGAQLNILLTGHVSKRPAQCFVTLGKVGIQLGVLAAHSACLP
jgi:hypothetical protein